MHPDYETLLRAAGFPLAIQPLAAMFEIENVTDPQLRYQLTLDVIERTMMALAILARPKTMH